MRLTGNKLVHPTTFNWVIDVGATDHMCCELSMFDNIKSLNDQHHTMVVLDGRKIKVESSGNVTLHNGICLKKVLYILEFNYNLISVH